MERRRQAEFLRDSELLREILREMAEDERAAWETASEMSARERCHSAITAIRRLEGAIYARITDIVGGDSDRDT